ncbi:hypothetical protein ACI3ET_01520 [Ornithinimicrobium sp. LYQ121]|uniref:AMIN-like domain-containing (lipo)protein n=1 Tax=Ornithinimicrobium sp. LYQ121 TaxID=3378801 RepID=UPI003853B147
MRRRVVAAAVAALLLAGCQGAEEPGTDTPTPTGASTSTEPAQPSTEEPSTDETSGDETSSDPPTGDQTDDDDDDDDTSEDDPSGTSEPTADLPAWVDATETDEQEAGEQQDEGQEISGVRVGLHDDYDRVVLDLSGDDAVLGWVAFYEDEAVADGSGEPIEVAGSAVLQVSVRGIDWTTESDVRYDGTTVTGEGLEVVTEVVFGTLFEGQQQVFLGVEEQTPYRVFTLDDPARIVVDVQDP